jgi:hypothetical protein
MDKLENRMGVREGCVTSIEKGYFYPRFWTDVKRRRKQFSIPIGHINLALIEWN